LSTNNLRSGSAVSFASTAMTMMLSLPNRIQHAGADLLATLAEQIGLPAHDSGDDPGGFVRHYLEKLRLSGIA